MELTVTANLRISFSSGALPNPIYAGRGTLALIEINVVVNHLSYEAWKL